MPWPLLKSPAQPLARPAFHLGGKAIARNTAFNIVGQMVPLVVGIDHHALRHPTPGPRPLRHPGTGLDRAGLLRAFRSGDRSRHHQVCGRTARPRGNRPHPFRCLDRPRDSIRHGATRWRSAPASSPVLVDRILKIPAGARADTLWVSLTLAVSFRINFAIGSLKGFLSAIQRFDLVNAIAVPTSALVRHPGWGVGARLWPSWHRATPSRQPGRGRSGAHFVFCLQKLPGPRAPLRVRPLSSVAC